MKAIYRNSLGKVIKEKDVISKTPTGIKREATMSEPSYCYSIDVVNDEGWVVMRKSPKRHSLSGKWNVLREHLLEKL